MGAVAVLYNLVQYNVIRLILHRYPPLPACIETLPAASDQAMNVTVFPNAQVGTQPVSSHFPNMFQKAQSVPDLNSTPRTTLLPFLHQFPHI